MATITQDIEIFLNKAQQKVAALGNEIRDHRQNGLPINNDLFLLQELVMAIGVLQYENEDLTNNQKYEIISYCNKRADLTVLPIANFDSSCLVNTVVVGAGYLEGPQGDDGYDGWSPVFGLASDGERRVLQVIDWQGGEDTKPATGKYVGASGLVTLIGDGVDIRGSIGATGTDGTNGWAALYAVVEDGDRRVLQVSGWTGGTGTEPSSGSYVGSSGLVPLIADAVDIRGSIGLTGDTGSQGIQGDPGDSSYTYIAYASDASGTDFTTTFDSSLDYIAIKTVTEEIASPVASDFTGLWKNYKGEQGDPFNIDVIGGTSDRNTYDNTVEGFTFLDEDTGNVYIKASGATGDWGPAISFVGDKGWSPEFAIVSDGDRRVLQIVAWAGGEGTEPSSTDQYIGSTGIVNLPADAIDIRGPQGERFFPDAEGLIADITTYDAELTDFIYHATDEGLVYIKLSDTSGDWSTGYTWRGERGADGPAGSPGEGLTDDCRVSSTAALTGTYDSGDKTFTITALGSLTIDGVALSVGDRVLIWHQSTKSENGIYEVTVAGDGSTSAVLTRTSDFDTSTKIKKFKSVYIQEGTTYAGYSFSLTTPRPGLTLDTTSLDFYYSDSSAPINQTASGNNYLTYTSTGGGVAINIRGDITNATITLTPKGLGVLQISGTGYVTSNLRVGGNLDIETVGKGLKIKEGSNATMGTATLVAGTVTVNTTSVTASSRIFLTIQSLGTVAVPQAIGVTSVTASTSFTITSADITDTSVIAWHIIEPS